MKTPFTNVYGLARTLLALNTLLTLLSSSADSLFRPLSMSTVEAGFNSAIVNYGLFALAAPQFGIAKWIAVLGLVVVASGWRPRVTGLLHWWISASVFSTLVAQDGGDQCAAALTLLLVPLTLCDPRKWHWSQPPQPVSTGDLIRWKIGASALFMARLQVALLYLHAAVGKASVPEWVNGTAIYYWLLDTRIGVPSDYHGIVLALLGPNWVAPLLTWSPVALEYALFLALAMGDNNRIRPYLFWIGVVFHLGNVAMFGLVSFMLTMCAALVLLLRPAGMPYAWDTLHSAGAALHRLAHMALERGKRNVGARTGPHRALAPQVALRGERKDKGR